jgi:hypothetical protein
MLEYTRPQKVVLKYHAVLCALKDTGKSIVICVEALSCRLSQAVDFHKLIQRFGYLEIFNEKKRFRLIVTNSSFEDSCLNQKQLTSVSLGAGAVSVAAATVIPCPHIWTSCGTVLITCGVERLHFVFPPKQGMQNSH